MQPTVLVNLNKPFRLLVILMTLACLAGSDLMAQSFTEDFSIWPVDLKINGGVIACAGPEIDSSIVDSFKRSVGEKDSKIVALWLDTTFEADAFKAILGDEDNVISFGKDGGEIPIEKLKDALASAKGVLLFSGKSPSADASRTLDQTQGALNEVVQRGGTVCAVGPVISSLGTFRHDGVDSMSMLTKDLGLVPDGIVYHGYIDSEDRRKMYGALAEKPHSVAIGIPKNTAIVLRGRKMIALGKQKVTFAITANERQPFRVQHLADVSGRRASPYDSVVDLTAWRRDAIERQLPAFPGDKPPPPVVEKGTLLIVGGGRTPKGLMAEMVELAGGKDAHMVFVPCTERDSISEEPGVVRQWKKMGVASATVFHTKDRTKANSDKEFLKMVENATGVWFGGGRQWNFADSYYGTEAHRLMKCVLAKGGVIGGSSAGASIQGGYLARANPVANFDIMAPGYERGLGFLPGVAIDQHFSQRGRQKDMTQLANRYPQLLGIGIDESTAIRVEGSVAEVVGRGKVFFYDRQKDVIPGKDDFIALAAGQSFDLKRREIVEESEE